MTIVTTQDEFVLFGPAHLAVVFVTVTAVVALISNRRRLQAAEDQWARRVVSAGLLGNELVSWVVGLVQGHGRIPFQLCDLALVMTVWGLWSLRRSVSELAYFWGLAASLQAVLTPDLREPFPTYWWVKFFAGHCGIVLGAVYLGATGRVQPTGRSIWRVWGWTNLYAAAAGALNGMLGTNFGYLAHKPAHPSLLDHFGPWPYYIVGLELVGLLSFYLYYAPFVIGRWWTGRAKSLVGASSRC